MPVYNRTKHTAVKIIAVSVKVLKPILGGNDFISRGMAPHWPRPTASGMSAFL